MRKQLAARYQTVETRKDGVKFTSKALAAAAERLQAVSREYDRCQHALVEQARGHQTPETLHPCFHSLQMQVSCIGSLTGEWNACQQ